jgi:hypothetical protein
MEYSIYYFHSNYLTKIYTFIRDENLIEVNVLSVYDIMDEEYTKFKFIISIEEMKSCKKLYEYYLLSLLLTEDVNKLTYDDSIDFMGYTKNVWRFSFKKNWKGMYFTENFCNNYGLETYPEKGSIIIDEHNEEQKKYGKEFIKRNEFSTPNYLSKYIKIEIKKIEEELLKIEKDVNYQKKLVLFSSKIQQFINEDTLLYINKLLLA